MADSIIVFDGVCMLCSRWVARRRYRLFGRRDACVVPTADIADRFLR